MAASSPPFAFRQRSLKVATRPSSTPFQQEDVSRMLSGIRRPIEARRTLHWAWKRGLFRQTRLQGHPWPL